MKFEIERNYTVDPTIIITLYRFLCTGFEGGREREREVSMLMPGTAVSVGYHFYTRLMDDLKMLPLCHLFSLPLSVCLVCHKWYNLAQDRALRKRRLVYIRNQRFNFQLSKVNNYIIIVNYFR